MSIVGFPTSSAVPSDARGGNTVESPQRLKLRMQPCDGYTIVSVWGELGGETTDEMSRLLESLARIGRRRVLLDLSRLYDMDTAAIAQLSRWQNVLGASSGGLWLAAPRPWVRRLLEQACLRGTFTVYPTVAEALAAISPSEPERAGTSKANH